jgi:hypothetical protein
MAFTYIDQVSYLSFFFVLHFFPKCLFFSAPALPPIITFMTLLLHPSFHLPAFFPLLLYLLVYFASCLIPLGSLLADLFAAARYPPFSSSLFHTIFPFFCCISFISFVEISNYMILFSSQFNNLATSSEPRLVAFLIALRFCFYADEPSEKNAFATRVIDLS